MNITNQNHSFIPQLQFNNVTPHFKRNHLAWCEISATNISVWTRFHFGLCDFIKLWFQAFKSNWNIISAVSNVWYYNVLETCLFILLHPVLASNSEILLQAGTEEVSMCVKCNIEECVYWNSLFNCYSYTRHFPHFVFHSCSSCALNSRWLLPATKQGETDWETLKNGGWPFRYKSELLSFLRAYKYFSEVNGRYFSFVLLRVLFWKFVCFLVNRSGWRRRNGRWKLPTTMSNDFKLQRGNYQSRGECHSNVTLKQRSLEVCLHRMAAKHEKN